MEQIHRTVKMTAPLKAQHREQPKKKDPPAMGMSLFNSPRSNLNFGKRSRSSVRSLLFEPAAKRKPPSPTFLQFLKSKGGSSLGRNTMFESAPAKVPKKANFDSLSRDLKEHIVDFLNEDIPTLGALACVSKTLRTICYANKRWKGPLVELQCQLFDQNTRVQGQPTTPLPKAIPLYKRPLKSTLFLKWFDDQERRMDACKADDRHYREQVPLVVAVRHSNRVFRPDQDPWLYRDVSYREYYYQLGQLGFWAEVVCQCYCFEHSQCYACLELMQFGRDAPGMYCHRCGTNSLQIVKDHLREKVLGKLPSIRLFRTMPEWAKAIHKECLTAQQDSTAKEYALWIREKFERFG